MKRDYIPWIKIKKQKEKHNNILSAQKTTIKLEYIKRILHRLGKGKQLYR